MKTLLSAIAVFVLSGCWLGSPAHAQSVPCATLQEVRDLLRERHGEIPVVRGTANDQTLVFEIYASPSGTWSAVVTDLNGRSCLMMGGEGIEQITKSIRPEGPAL